MTEKGRVTAPVKLTKRARIIAAPVLVLVLALAVFAAHQLRRELTACFEWPDVELLVEDEPQPDYAYSEYYGGDRPFVNICTGADLLFRDKRGTDYYYVPSLEYIGMLFMPEYAHCVIRAPSDTEYLSISCSQGGLDKGPRSCLPPFDRNRGEAAAASLGRRHDAAASGSVRDGGPAREARRELPHL